MDDTNLLKTLIRYFTDSNSVSLPQEYAILWDQYTSDKPLIVDWHKLNDKLPDPGAITEIMFEEPKRFISILTIAMMEVLNIDRTPDNPIKFEQGRSARISGFEAKSNQKNISALRSADLNRLIVVEGKIKSMTNIFPVIVSRTYTCRLCGAA
jgi:DNA replicative helicase MCM subunit Mcm2 (Cdc46/Mcm family)